MKNLTSQDGHDKLKSYGCSIHGCILSLTDMREKTPDQLREQLESLKKEAFNLRFQQATGQLENTAQMRKARRDAARVKTILNEKARAAASEE